MFSGTVWKSSDFRNGSWMCNNAKDAKIEIGNTLRVSALNQRNAKTRRRKG
ncbi:MAG: hypothetical protein U9N46_08620 [Euryarchaeota archaeon]|nr:hypothetical protein [Euryarchaeota archaeon]